MYNSGCHHLYFVFLPSLNRKCTGGMPSEIFSSNCEVRYGAHPRYVHIALTKKMQIKFTFYILSSTKTHVAHTIWVNTCGANTSYNTCDVCSIIHGLMKPSIVGVAHTIWVGEMGLIHHIIYVMFVA